MRAIIMLMFLSIAGTCFAEDPLESLNTVEDTISTMENNLKAQGIDPDRTVIGRGAAGDHALRGTLYFLSDEPLSDRGWVLARPCVDEDGAASLNALESEACTPEAGEAPAPRKHLWKSRAAAAADLRAGVTVVALDLAQDGRWYVARVVDTSEIGNGYVAISAPFKAQLKNLRVVEE